MERNDAYVNLTFSFMPGGVISMKSHRTKTIGEARGVIHNMVIKHREAYFHRRVEVPFSVEFTHDKSGTLLKDDDFIMEDLHITVVLIEQKYGDMTTNHSKFSLMSGAVLPLNFRPKTIMEAKEIIVAVIKRRDEYHGLIFCVDLIKENGTFLTGDDFPMEDDAQNITVVVVLG